MYTTDTSGERGSSYEVIWRVLIKLSLENFPLSNNRIKVRIISSQKPQSVLW